MEKYLQELEVLKLELSQKEQKSQKLEKLLLEKDTAIIKHQQEQLKLRIALLDFENYKLQHKIVKKSESISAEMEAAKQFHKSLEEKYELTAGWGYNPDTLEIILKED